MNLKVISNLVVQGLKDDEKKALNIAVLKKALRRKTAILHFGKYTPIKGTGRLQVNSQEAINNSFSHKAFFKLSRVGLNIIKAWPLEFFLQEGFFNASRLKQVSGFPVRFIAKGINITLNSMQDLMDSMDKITENKTGTFREAMVSGPITTVYACPLVVGHEIEYSDANGTRTNIEGILCATTNKKFIEANPTQCKIAITALTTLGIDIGKVDLVEIDNGYKIIKVSTRPNFDIPKHTGPEYSVIGNAYTTVLKYVFEKKLIEKGK